MLENDFVNEEDTKLRKSKLEGISARTVVKFVQKETKKMVFPFLAHLANGAIFSDGAGGRMIVCEQTVISSVLGR